MVETDRFLGACWNARVLGTPEPGCFVEQTAMSTNELDGHKSIDPRTDRALTEYMSVLPEGGDVYTVVGQNGGTYTVDGREEWCTCPDHEHRGVQCKHLRRVAFATGEGTIPAGVDGVDPQLGEHTDETPRRAASDGGVVETTDTTDERDDGDERPSDCDCGDWNAGEGLPCWPCYRDGFEEPNPNVDDDRGGGDA
jgi:predicted nucleic acid-binding Zn finger protein